MTRVATQPLDSAACAKADDAFYAAHPEFVREDGSRIPLSATDPSQADLRAEWLDLYEASGGEVETLGDKTKPDDPVQPCPLVSHVVELVTDDGHSIPHAAFRMELIDGTVVTGALDETGCAIVEGLPPDTPFYLSFPDDADVRAKAFAARMKQGLDEAARDTVMGVLALPDAEVRRVDAVFRSYHGAAIAERCRVVFAGDDHLPLIEHLLAHARLVGGIELLEAGAG